MRSSSCCCGVRGGAGGSRTSAFAVSTSSPFSRPSSYLVMRPPAGSGVFSVMLQRVSAAEFRMYSWPPRTRTTGLCGAIASRSSRSGSRCSLSCASCQSLLETMTSPGFDAWTRACKRRHHVGQRSRARQIDAGPAAGAVQMVVHQPRDHRAALQIDHPRRRPGDRLHLIVVADGHDAIADDRDGFVDRETAIDGDDLAVEQDEIGRGRAGKDRPLCGQRRRGQEGEQERAQHAGSISRSTRLAKTRGSLRARRFRPAVRPSKLRARRSCQTVCERPLS